MVRHGIVVRGVDLPGAEQSKPVLLQMNDDDFPKGFLRDLADLGQPPLSTARTVLSDASAPAVLYQPVQRVVHLALVDLACNAIGNPRLDPTRVQSAGLVIRRVVRTRGTDDLSKPPSAWMRDAQGNFGWVKLDHSQESDDPDPARRPQLYSGQPALDQMLAAQTLFAAKTEIVTPSFVAAPEVCKAAGRTLAYAVIPTASGEASTQAPSLPQYDSQSLADSLPVLLKAGSHNAPQAYQTVDYRFMSDEYARANGATDFITFSTTLRMLYTVFGAFENTPQAQKLIAVLNRHFIYLWLDSLIVPLGMGAFYQNAASALMDYDPNAEPPQPAPGLVMPFAWDALSDQDQAQLVDAIAALLQTRSKTVLPPQGRFQDATRLYRLRLFFRVKPENPNCPTELVWSRFSDAFRIAAWYEGSGRAVAPVPLPDPTDRKFLQSAKPNSSFLVPAGLMNAMQGTTLSGLSNGAGGGGGGGLTLNWLCGFNIPLITICAFFVLNIFLTLLNIIFFWLPFIKICIPFPFSLPPGATSGDD